MRYRTIVLVCVTALVLSATRAAHAQDATDAQLAELNYQIRMLRASVKNLQDQNAKLRQEINTLRAENAAPAEPSPDEPVTKDQEVKDDEPGTSTKTVNRTRAQYTGLFRGKGVGNAIRLRRM